MHSHKNSLQSGEFLFCLGFRYNSFMQEEVSKLRNEFISRALTTVDTTELESLRVEFLGRNGRLTQLLKDIKNLEDSEKRKIGPLLNETKKVLEETLSERLEVKNKESSHEFDESIPGIKPQIGHTHLITRAINEISEVFERIGFVRRRYPEIETDFYAFEGLNMPTTHAARDEWETFFVEPNFLLTPHTSNGQVREMEQNELPIRMINISKTYRRQSDVSHVPMFHQFEGLLIDKNINITNLKGVLDYFAKNFFGENRKTRLRPYNFRFTEPSFEIDISCGVCGGAGCKLCKGGWLELGGAGMVHPNVLKAGKIDPNKFSGFAFGWGVERTFMMKSGISIPDVRILYSPDLRFLRQF